MKIDNITFECLKADLEIIEYPNKEFIKVKAIDIDLLSSTYGYENIENIIFEKENLNDKITNTIIALDDLEVDTELQDKIDYIIKNLKE